MKTLITKVPADNSIKDVVCIVVLEASVVRTVNLTGTEKDKLAQYKEAFGIDWAGTKESVATEIVQEPSTVSLELGKHKPIKNKVTLAAEAQIRKLCEEAKRYLAENEILKDKRVTEKELVETQLSE